MSNNNFEQIPLVPIDSIVKKLNLVVGNKMILIAGRCKAIFDGRIKSTLAEGDRFLMIKKDLSIILDGPIGVKPLNWQKPLAGPIEFKLSSSLLEMVTHRTKTKETLIITFTNLANISVWHATDETELEIYGDESDLVKYLVANPDLIEEGFQILRTEYSTDVGPVDIRGMSKSGEAIIEVKKRNATPANAHQLKRYIEYFQSTEKKSVRGILVATEFPKKVLAYLEQNNLEAKIIHWKEIFPMIKRPKSAKLEDFFDKKNE
ncbi:MAG: endonuclease NucS domain-containing protein [Candidatus Heimdallarchaeaceae archaeon]